MFAAVYFVGYSCSVATQAPSKINRLATAAPPGSLLLAGHLQRLGFSHDLQQHYARSGWLERVGRGAFARPPELPTWQGALYALQTQAKLPVHVGGPTALGLLGRGHYLALGGEGGDRNDRAPLDLFAPPRTVLPAWFERGPWALAPRLTRTDLLPPDLGVEARDVERLPLRVASAERAMLEVLYLMPEAVDPTSARELMDGLVDLRPERVTELLQACQSVRVKRLFLMLADVADHPWLRRVELDGVDLGRGKRSVAGGGVYVPQHRLAVPAELLRDAAGEKTAEEAGEGGQ